MGSQPGKLIYGLEDRPDVFSSMLLAIQHIFVMSSTIILPVVLIQAIGGTFSQTKALVGYTMIAAGIGTILQSVRFGRLGSGYFVPNLCGPNFLSVSLHAAWVGGLPLMHGMIIVAGIFEAVFSQFIHFLRKLFTHEISGLVILMVGISLMPLGVSKFVGVRYAGDVIHLSYTAVSCTTLFVMIWINIWSKGKWKLYSVLIAMIVGYILAAFTGYLTKLDFSHFLRASWVAFPGNALPHFKFSFLPSFILPFIIVSLVGALKTFGNISMAQKINDPNWQGPDTNNISKGLLADSFSVMLSGVLGGMATDSSASNVGLSLATGVTSRCLGYVVGIAYMLMGFSPKVTAVFSIMPDPVMGAILLFVISFMVFSGLQIILQSKPEVRTIFIIGLAFCFGLSVDLLPGMYIFLPNWLQPIFNSSLTLSTIVAILLNFVFNIKKIVK